MTNSPLRSVNSGVSIALADLRQFSEGWIIDAQYRQLSPTTIESRKGFMYRFLWWLNEFGHDHCSHLELKGYFAYLATSHQRKEGRWNNPDLVKPLRPRTIRDHYTALRTFFRFLIAEGYVESSPLEAVKAPISRSDQIQPFNEDQVEALLKVARNKTRHSQRDQALLMFMLDTGVRASELCNLTLEDVDVVNRKAIVLGKGNKHRAIFFGRETGRALWQYLKKRSIDPSKPLFLSERGDPFTRSGLLQLIERLGACLASLEI